MANTVIRCNFIVFRDLCSELLVLRFLRKCHASSKIVIGCWPSESELYIVFVVLQGLTPCFVCPCSSFPGEFLNSGEVINCQASPRAKILCPWALDNFCRDGRGASMLATSEALWQRPQAVGLCSAKFEKFHRRNLPEWRVSPVKRGEFNSFRLEQKTKGLTSSDWKQTFALDKPWRPRVVCFAAQGEGENGGTTNVGEWMKKKIEEGRKKEQPVGESVMRMIATATAAPIAQYIDSPFTALHSLDPRVKQAWLLALVVLPSRAHIYIRFGIVVLLVGATVGSLPRRIWQDQLGRMLLLSGFLFVLTALGTDGVPPVVQPRTPPPSLEGLPELVPSLTGYSYVVMKVGPLLLTRKGLSLAAAASCFSFTVLQSATLCLTTTTPEQLAAALQWYLAPLSRFGAPVGEIILTLLLSLRFIGLVFDEVRNIALAVVARGVQWKILKPMETIDTLLTLFGRLFRNLLNHSEKIAEAMVARGFKGNASNHKIYFLTKLSLTGLDKLAIIGLIVLVALTSYSEMVLPV